MTVLEMQLYWGTVFTYAGSAVLYIWGWVFKAAKPLSVALLVSGAGLLIHTLSLGLRWASVGHGPYLKRYEAFSSDVWVILALFIFLQGMFPLAKAAGAVIMPALFLILGLGALANPQVEFLSPAMRSPWLVVHVGFAKLSLATAVIASGLSILYMAKAWVWLPERFQGLTPAGVDRFGERFVALSFYFLTIMIASGAVWANTAWGNYWRWDPVESWSLATWLLYGVCLHLRSTLGWRGERAAAITLAAMVATVVLFLGFGNFSLSIHSIYTAP